MMPKSRRAAAIPEAENAAELCRFPSKSSGFASPAPAIDAAGDRTPLIPAVFRSKVVGSRVRPPSRRPCARSLPMPSRDPLAEFQVNWLPHVSDAGLERLIELLEKS